MPKSAKSLPSVPVSYQGPLVRTYSVTKLTFEPAGSSFFQKFEAKHDQSGPGKATDAEGAASPPESEADAEKYNRTKIERKAFNVSANLRMALEQMLYCYRLCCVSPDCTEEKLKSNFKKLVVIFHPDKANCVSVHEEDPELVSALPELSTMSERQKTEHFSNVRLAYEVLMNREDRIKYDSVQQLDNYLPFDVDAAEFFSVVPRLFAREAHWCVDKPVPQFGDESTPAEEVRKFYAYWYQYKSWRDFSCAAMHLIDNDAPREERKWSIRDAQKVSNRLAKLERDRIIKFLNLCESRDQRLHPNGKKVAQSEAATASGATKVVKNVPLETVRQNVERRVRLQAAAREARGQVKTLFKKYLGTSQEQAGNTMLLSSKLNTWLADASAADVLRLHGNLNYELQLGMQPAELQAHRLRKIFEAELLKA